MGNMISYLRTQKLAYIFVVVVIRSTFLHVDLIIGWFTVRKPILVINLWTDLNEERIVHRQSQFSLSGGCCRDGIANSGGPRPEGSANYDSWCGIMTARPEIMKAAPSRCADRLAPNTPCFWKYNSTVDCVHD